MAGTVGLAPNVDVAVIVPMITATLQAVTTQVDGNGKFVRGAETNTKFSGIGDIAAVLKVKAAKLPGPEIPDPGGLALMLTMRLPTGSRENLRGLGIYSHDGIGGVLRGKGPFKPHADRRLRVLEQERRRPNRKRDRCARQGAPSGTGRRGLRDRGRIRK